MLKMDVLIKNAFTMYFNIKKLLNFYLLIISVLYYDLNYYPFFFNNTYDMLYVLLM
jgi:hypothetical protein